MQFWKKNGRKQLVFSFACGKCFRVVIKHQANLKSFWETFAAGCSGLSGRIVNKLLEFGIVVHFIAGFCLKIVIFRKGLKSDEI